MEVRSVVTGAALLALALALGTGDMEVAKNEESRAIDSSTGLYNLVVRHQVLKRNRTTGNVGGSPAVSRLEDEDYQQELHEEEEEEEEVESEEEEDVKDEEDVEADEEEDEVHQEVEESTMPHTTQRTKGDTGHRKKIKPTKDKNKTKNKKRIRKGHGGGGIGKGGKGGKGGKKGQKGLKKGLKKLKKYMLPLLLAYKLKFFALIPLLLGGLVLIVATTGFAGFFFALFAVGVGLKKD